MPADRVNTDHPGVRVVVIVAGRGRLPFVSLHGEALLTHAMRSAASAGAGPVQVVVDHACRADVVSLLTTSGTDTQVLDVAEWWLTRDGRADVLHDPLCPLVPAAFLAEMVGGCADGVARAAFQPVTDTVKTAEDGRISGTLDRDRLGIVVAPVVLPAGIGAGEPPPPLAFGALVAWLRERTPVSLMRAPSLSRRVGDEGGVTLLECVDETARRVR